MSVAPDEFIRFLMHVLPDGSSAYAIEGFSPTVTASGNWHSAAGC
jgi:hypothetical protein